MYDDEDSWVYDPDAYYILSFDEDGEFYNLENECYRDNLDDAIWQANTWAEEDALVSAVYHQDKIVYVAGDVDALPS